MCSHFFVLYLEKEVLVGWFRRAVNIFGCGAKLFSFACPLISPSFKNLSTAHSRFFDKSSVTLRVTACFQPRTVSKMELLAWSRQLSVLSDRTADLDVPFISFDSYSRVGSAHIPPRFSQLSCPVVFERAHALCSTAAANAQAASSGAEALPCKALSNATGTVVCNAVPESAWHSSIKPPSGWSTCPTVNTNTGGATCNDFCRQHKMQCYRGQDDQFVDPCLPEGVGAVPDNGCDSGRSRQLCQCGLPPPTEAPTVVPTAAPTEERVGWCQKPASSSLSLCKMLDYTVFDQASLQLAETRAAEALKVSCGKHRPFVDVLLHGICDDRRRLFAGAVPREICQPRV